MTTTGMQMKTPDIDPLLTLIEQGARKAQSIGAEVLVSHSQSYDAIDPLDLFTAAESVTSDRWYWEQPDEDRAMVSVGVLSGMTPPRNVRFQEVGRYLRQYASSATVVSDTDAGESPRLFAAFSYDPRYTQDRLVWQGFPSTYLLTPRLTLIRDGDRYTLTQNTLVSANIGSDAFINAAREFNEQLVAAFENQKESSLIVDEIAPDKSSEDEIRQYIRAVARAEAAIQRGDLEVATIARRRKITTGGLYRLNRALKYLRGRFPHSRIVAAGRHGSTFIGYASDSLVSKRGSTVTATTSAGSIRRGDTQELDSALATQLANSPDEVEHHELCVDHLYEAFETHCENVEASDEPRIRSTTERHELLSRVSGTLQDDSSLMDLIADLHPVVDASGVPTEQAAELIFNEEQTDRGWFSAPFGWLDLNGDGDFITATNASVIRAPIMGQQRAYLFTSSPIHSGVDPEDLLAQTDRQMEPLRSALIQ